MGNQQLRLEESKVQRLSNDGVESQAFGDSKWWTHIIKYDEDIVCAHVKA